MKKDGTFLEILVTHNKLSFRWVTAKQSEMRMSYFQISGGLCGVVGKRATLLWNNAKGWRIASDVCQFFCLVEKPNFYTPSRDVRKKKTDEEMKNVWARACASACRSTPAGLLVYTDVSKKQVYTHVSEKTGLLKEWWRRGKKGWRRWKQFRKNCRRNKPSWRRHLHWMLTKQLSKEEMERK